MTGYWSRFALTLLLVGAASPILAQSGPPLPGVTVQIVRGQTPDPITVQGAPTFMDYARPDQLTAQIVRGQTPDPITMQGASTFMGYARPDQLAVQIVRGQTPGPITVQGAPTFMGYARPDQLTAQIVRVPNQPPTIPPLSVVTGP